MNSEKRKLSADDAEFRRFENPEMGRGREMEGREDSSILIRSVFSSVSIGVIGE